MIITLKEGVAGRLKENLIKWLESYGLQAHVTESCYQTTIGLIGDTSQLDMELIQGLEIVESILPVSETYKCASRRFHPHDSVVSVGDGEKKVLFGGSNFSIIAGPCSVESEEGVIETAKAVKAAGADMLRGGAFKPRTSPYDFQGLGAIGLEFLKSARKETGLPIVSEIMNTAHLDCFSDIDIIQVGARNSQNFDLLKELGQCRKPILLKRGMAETIKEWLMSAEYIMAGGNENIILCERGIRSFDPMTRNLLDLTAIPLIKELSHLPVIVDPSHSTGKSRLVKPMSLAAAACGAHGLIIEVHCHPEKALCDGAQSLTPSGFHNVVTAVQAVRKALESMS